MKRFLILILILSVSCSKEKEDESLYRDRLATLKEQISKPEAFTIYLYYRNVDNMIDGKVLIDSTSNKNVIIENLSININKKTYDVRKIWGMDWRSKEQNQKYLVTQMNIVFLR
jgi:hypothetical protein